MEEVKLVDVLLKNLLPADLIRTFGCLLHSLGKDLLRLRDLGFEDCDVTFEHLNLKLALFSFVEVDIIIHIVTS